MNETNWLDRASKRIDAWPVGPMAALLLGMATGFFCWAMPYSPAVGRFTLIVAPALLAFILTFAAFRWIDARSVSPTIDEGDDQEDWLTRPARPRRAAGAAADRQPPRPAPRPFIIEAADEVASAPLVDSPAVEPVAAPPELLLDEPLPVEGRTPPRMVEQPSALPIEHLMARLAARIEGGEAAVTIDSAPSPLPPPVEPAAPPLSDAEALRAALADLHRMARRS